MFHSDFYYSVVHTSKFIKQMKGYFNEDHLYDVFLIAGVDGRRVPAHRLVLSTSSPYFTAMFSGATVEASKKEITLVNVTGAALQSLVSFCYTSCVELSEDTVQELLTTADLLQIDEVISACSAFISRRLNLSNCLGIALYAEQRNLKPLMEEAQKLAFEQFTQVASNQEFLQLKADQLGKLLVSDDLYMRSEEDVFHALNTWLQHDRKTREKDIPNLLEHIRLPLLPSSFIVDHVTPLCVSAGCVELLLESLENRSSPVRLRKPRHKLLAIGSSYSRDDNRIETYCPQRNEWTPLTSFEFPRRDFKACVIENRLFLIGGWYYNACLDLSTLTWEKVNPLRTWRKGLNVAVLEGMIYAIGGHNSLRMSLNTVERWDPVSGTWSYVSPMLQRRSHIEAAVLNGRLYVIGGHDSREDYHTMECYDPRTDTWSMKAPMSISRVSPGVVVAKGRIYASSGIGPLERYDPDSDTWTIIADWNRGYSYIHVAVLEERIITCGAYYEAETVSRMSQFQPDTNEWVELAPTNIDVVRDYVTVDRNHIPDQNPTHTENYFRRFRRYASDCIHCLRQCIGR